MSASLDAVLRSWSFDPWLLAALVLTAVVYARGWFLLRGRDPLRWHAGHLAAFVAGLAMIYVALASPIEPFAALLLQVHMIQHLLLTMVAPPLIWLGAPLLPLLRGLPRTLRSQWIAPLLRARPVRRLFERLSHPLIALGLFVAATWLWHTPLLYDLALRSRFWHYVQHACFLVSSLLFWYPVIRPWPSRPKWSRWVVVPSLIAADLSNTILSALLTFSDRVLYPYYLEVPRLGGISAIDDQSAAGVIMWVPGSLVFLLPLASITVGLLSGKPSAQPRRVARLSRPVASPSRMTSPSTRPWDVLRLPLLGRFLMWRYARIALQVPLLLVAGLLIVDGLRGPQIAPMNLAGVLPWIHWRGLVVIGLLAAGNVFCMGCPFLLPRTLARKWLPAGREWPRRLQSKWLAVVLVALFLWAYEAFALWNSPAWTAWLAIGYFAAAFVVDGLFRGASFCKYVCPIGQFNFVQSLVSPLQVQVREPAVCTSCRTMDCMRGREGIPGCELLLVVPRKADNMDCTTCLDCAHACPHDNVGLIAGMPGQALWRARGRSLVGRKDLAALILVLVFGAFANAAGMVGPVLDAEAQLHHILSPLAVTTIFYVLALVVLPVTFVGSAAALSRWWGQLPGSVWDVATRASLALVPIGFAMWLAHFGFHFATSYETILPVTHRFASDLGLAALGTPEWSYACCRPAASWLIRAEILSLDVGCLTSLYVAWRHAQSQASTARLALKALMPWAALIILLFALGVLILLQPMQMRGTF